MERKCIHCNQPIPEGRLKALPKTKTCTGCSNTGKVAGHPLITGKTEYSEIQIVDPETAERLLNMQQRKGYGVSEGVKFDSDKPKEIEE
jgi:CTP:molybdopterin cytidylyltransferase MocA